jgi:hypothetical protein
VAEAQICLAKALLYTLHFNYIKAPYYWRKAWVCQGEEGKGKGGKSRAGEKREGRRTRGEGEGEEKDQEEGKSKVSTTEWGVKREEEEKSR